MEVITQPRKPFYKKWWFWVLVILGIILALFVAFVCLFIKPWDIPKQENVDIPAYSDPKCTRDFSPQFNAGPYYEGNLFDTHLHFPPSFEHKESGQRFAVLGKDITLNNLVCELEKEKVVGSTAFYFPNFWQMKSMNSLDDQTLNNWTAGLEN